MVAAVDKFSQELLVGTGFETDMISAPWGFRWLAAWLLKGCEREVVLHDCLRRMPTVSNFSADATFHDALGWNYARGETPMWKAVVIYYAVRLQAVLFGKK